MSDVSCRVLEVFFREARRRGIDVREITRGVDLPLDLLQDGQARISWHHFVVVLHNIGKLWSPEELEAFGGAYLRSPLMQPFRLVARLLFRAKDFYEWVYAPRSPVQRVFACVTPTFLARSPSEAIVTLTLPEGYPTSREFNYISCGSARYMPRIVGEPPAQVEMMELHNGVRFELKFSARGGSLAWLRRMVAWPITTFLAGQALKEAHEDLRERYFELEAARAKIARQATQLNTAYSISQVIHGDLDLGHTLGLICKALIEVAGFTFARVTLQTEVEGLPAAHRAEYGAEEPAGPRFERPVVLRGRAVGTLRVDAQPGTDVAEVESALDYVVPTITMAIDDALTFTAVQSYRDSLELKVVERTAELEAARDHLSRSIESLEKAQAARDRLFANINHEIRTPLSLITLLVHELEERLAGGPPEHLERLAGIERSARGLLHLIDGLLLLAAGHEGKLTLRARPTDLAELVRQITGMYQASARAAGVSLFVDAPTRCIVELDEAAIGRVVVNLITNAIKFTPEGGSVRVDVSPTGSISGGPGERRRGVTVTVQDTGVGIDPSFRQHLFERFSQGRPAVRPGARGSGIGLAIVKELVEAHGGSVLAEPNPGGGSTFRIVLPERIRPKVDLRPNTDPAPVPRPAIGERPISGPIGAHLRRLAPDDRGEVDVGAGEATILVAEDDPELLDAITRVLSKRYRVLTASDGLVALRLAQEHAPDLLVTDVAMPGLDGIELTSRFQAIKTNRLAPVIVLTADASEATRMAGFRSGAVDYITKPFSPNELVARVSAQLSIRHMALRLLEYENLAALGTLSAGLAHEIRNPANGVVNAVAPLRSVLPPEALEETGAGELLSVIEECAGQLSHLSKQLLGFLRPGRMETSLEQPAELVNHAQRLASAALARVRVIRSVRAEGPLRCARALIAQTLANLLENAAKAAGPGGTVTIEVRRDGDRFVFEVGDDGPGVPAELRERIFEPFFTTRDPGEGTGLGLPMARQIVGRHGGSLIAVDVPRGALFRLELPEEPPRGATAGDGQPEHAAAEAGG